MRDLIVNIRANPRPYWTDSDMLRESNFDNGISLKWVECNILKKLN